MSLWRDTKSGWKARPAASAALAAIGLSVGLLSALGTRTWVQAGRETRSLLQAWPPDRTTLLIPESLDQDEALLLLERLPAGSWWAWTLSGDILWVGGALPPELTPKEGSPLQADLIEQAFPAGLVAPSTDWQIGGIGTVEDIAFEVLGRTELPESASVLLPAALRPGGAPAFQRIEIRRPAADLLPQVVDLPFFAQLSFLDHQQQRKQAGSGFRRLTLQLSLLGLAAAGLTALILQSLIRLELRERRFEFALRRSLGAQPSDIRMQILTEMFLTVGMPSLIGVAVMLPLLPPAAWMLLGIVPGWFVLCALPPAQHAASLPPHEALKEG